MPRTDARAIDGWARLSDDARLDRAVEIARVAITTALADLDPEAREKVFDQWRTMTGSERDDLIADVLKAEGLSDALVDDVRRRAIEKNTP